MQTPTEPMTEITPGAIFEGRYQVKATLGEGGMGAVYSALDLQRDSLPCAIKVIRANKRDNERYIQRLEREREVMAKLTHPNIVEVFNVNASAQGQSTYLVMPLLSGAPLGDWIKEQRRGPAGLSVQRYLKLIIQALDALAYAHSHNVIHRDLKPDNLYVCEDERGLELIKILDFGIAKDLESSTQLTDGTSGGMMGTPRYMSPEQIQGEQVGPYTDLYALVTMMYEQLCGRHPYDHPELNNLKEVKGLPAPFRMSWHHMNTEVPPLLELPSLWPHLAPALVKRPFDRAQDARALRDTLKRWLSEHPQDRALLMPVRRPQRFYDPTPSTQGQDAPTPSTRPTTRALSAQLQVSPEVAHWGTLTLKVLIGLIGASLVWRIAGYPSIPIVDPYLTGFMRRVLSLLDLIWVALLGA